MGPEILVVAGDPSGDLHASRLVRALQDEAPGLRAAAVGGAWLKAEADEFLFDLAALGVTGFFEPLRRLPAFVGLLKRLREFMKSRRPSAVVCVDFYGFNRWVLEAARREGIPAYYYISPQVWASRPGRIRTLKRLVRRMLVIFPFEEELYRKAGVPASFVGHPLLDHLPPPSPAPSAPSGGRGQGAGGTGPRIGLLPGSRSGEVRRHLPILLGAVEILRRAHPAAEAPVFAAPHLPDSSYAEAVRRGCELVREPDYRRRSGLDLALTSSGTATLENALLGLPMVVVYKMHWPTFAVARALIRVPFVSMPNLLAGKRLVPELLQHHATPERVARAALELLSDGPRLESLRRELAGLRGVLGGPGASARAARVLLAEIAPRAPAGGGPRERVAR